MGEGGEESVRIVNTFLSPIESSNLPALACYIFDICDQKNPLTPAPQHAPQASLEQGTNTAQNPKLGPLRRRTSFAIGRGTGSGEGGLHSREGSGPVKMLLDLSEEHKEHLAFLPGVNSSGPGRGSGVWRCVVREGNRGSARCSLSPGLCYSGRRIWADCSGVPEARREPQDLRGRRQ